MQDIKGKGGALSLFLFDEMRFLKSFTHRAEHTSVPRWTRRKYIHVGSAAAIHGCRRSSEAHSYAPCYHR